MHPKALIPSPGWERARVRGIKKNNKEAVMSISQNSVVSAEVVPNNKTASEALWEKALDEPSLRRLLRDGHRTEATTSLLSQLEEDM
jgi:hypothetical protein